MRWDEGDFSRELGVAEGRLRSIAKKANDALVAELSRDELVEVLHDIIKTTKIKKDVYGKSR